MGRTIPSWRMVVVGELERLKRFRQFPRSEDKEIFDDLLNRCRLYASYGSTMALPVKEIPRLMPVLFGQHKRLGFGKKHQIDGIIRWRDLRQDGVLRLPRFESTLNLFRIGIFLSIA